MDHLSAEVIQKFECFGEDGDWALLELPEIEFFTREYTQEINKDHPLYNIGFQPIARRYSKDDVFFILDDGKCIILHLTYSNKNLNGWPKFKMFETYDKALDYMETEYCMEFQ